MHYEYAHNVMYAACPIVKSEVLIRGEGGGLGPLFLNFLDPPLSTECNSAVNASIPVET